MDTDGNLKLDFESVEECSDLKNQLISFIKKAKRNIRDKGIKPNLTFNYKQSNNDGNNIRK